MLDQFFSVNLPDGQAVCIAPLASALYKSVEPHDLGDGDGYFVYEYNLSRPHAGMEILAKAASYDAATRLAFIYLQAAKHMTATA